MLSTNASRTKSCPVWGALAVHNFALPLSSTLNGQTLPTDGILSKPASSTVLNPSAMPMPISSCYSAIYISIFVCLLWYDFAFASKSCSNLRSQSLTFAMIPTTVGAMTCLFCLCPTVMQSILLMLQKSERNHQLRLVVSPSFYQDFGSLSQVLRLAGFLPPRSQ